MEVVREEEQEQPQQDNRILLDYLIPPNQTMRSAICTSPYKPTTSRCGCPSSK